MDYHKPWSYYPYEPVCTDVFGAPGKEYSFLILDVKPFDNRVFISWESVEKADRYSVRLIPYGGDMPSREIKSVEVIVQTPSATVDGLADGIDYEIQIRAYYHETFLGRCLNRMVRCGKISGTVVSYIHPDDYSFSYSGRSPASPGVLRLPTGEMLVSHDVYWGDEPQMLTKIFSSKDDGASWQFVCDVVPCFWGKLFWHKDALYLLGCSTECGDLLLGRSLDYGRTWSAPVVLYPGGTRETGGPMRASLPVIAHKGRLWTSMDVGSYVIGYHDTVIVSVKEDADLMEPKNWVCSEPLHYDPDWPGTSKGAPITGFLEGNMVVGPDQEMYDVLRYETRGGEPSYGLAGLVKADIRCPGKRPSLYKIIPFEGNLSRFTITKYEPENGYYAVVSRVVNEPTYYRGRLSLMFSKDLENWQFVRDLLDMGPMKLPDWPNKTAFQYPDFFIENDMIYLVSRTAINGAYNYHNANYITFHKFPLHKKEAE